MVRKYRTIPVLRHLRLVDAPELVGLAGFRHAQRLQDLLGGDVIGIPRLVVGPVRRGPPRTFATNLREQRAARRQRGAKEQQPGEPYSRGGHHSDSFCARIGLTAAPVTCVGRPAVVGDGKTAPSRRSGRTAGTGECVRNRVDRAPENDCHRRDDQYDQRVLQESAGWRRAVGQRKRERDGVVRGERQRHATKRASDPRPAHTAHGAASTLRASAPTSRPASITPRSSRCTSS